MSRDWVKDMDDMHVKFGVNQWFIEKLHRGDTDLLRKYLMFRLLMCNEEMHETLQAANNGDAEEVVDGLIDLCVFAIGTLNVMGVDAHEAWDRVWRANMEKAPGVKAGRPNAFGLPDLIKPSGWIGPSHADNHGELSKILE